MLKYIHKKNRSFYLKKILHPIFMFHVRHFPEFLDYCYIYLNELQHQVQGKLLQPDFIDQLRTTLKEGSG